MAFRKPRIGSQASRMWAEQARARRQSTFSLGAVSRLARELQSRPTIGNVARFALRNIGEYGGISAVTNELINYSRSSRISSSGLGRAVGLRQILDALNYLFGRRRQSSDLPSSAIADAIQILHNAGFSITPPAPARQRPSSTTPPVGGGTSGGPGVAEQTGPSGMPTGSFPGRQYVGMRHVTSSNVYAIGYNPETRTMRVQYLASWLNAGAVRGRGHIGKNRVRGRAGSTVSNYRSGPGPTYDYYNVPERVFNAIDNAGSKGRAIWDQLRIRGTAYGHKFDYALVGVSLTPVMDSLTRKPVAKVTYVPRKATGPGSFRPRVFRQGQGTFRSVLNHRT